jgi:hypothetical protein
MKNHGRFRRLGTELILGLGLLMAVSLFGQQSNNYCTEENYLPYKQLKFFSLGPSHVTLQLFNSKGKLLQTWHFSQFRGNSFTISRIISWVGKLVLSITVTIPPTLPEGPIPR